MSYFIKEMDFRLPYTRGSRDDRARTQRKRQRRQIRGKINPDLKSGHSDQPKNKKQKGGSGGRQPKVVTNQVYGFKEGSNPRQSALKYQENMNAEQNNLNQTGGVNHKGEKLSRKTKNSERKRKTKKDDKIYSSKHIRIKQKEAENKQKKGNIKGGSGSGRNTTVTVPQFNPPGPQVSPLDPNSASVKGNENSLQAEANASGDCYATNSCVKKGGTRRGGTRRGGTRRGGTRRGGTRRGGRRRGGNKGLVKNKWGCMSGGIIKGK